MPNLDPTAIGGAIAFLAAAVAGFKKYSAVREKERPIFENGEREAVRRALSLLGAASTDYRERIAKLEIESEEGRREHARLTDRIADLERRVTQLRNKQASA
jgi:predicted  nucleic acid-binding Zn-ribbon protein